MKILFVERIVEYIDPMHLELMSAFARRAGHTTYLSVLAQDDLETDLKRIKPDLVAFGGVKTGEHRHYVQASRTIKKISKDIPIIMGGAHTTFNPEIVEDPGID